MTDQQQQAEKKRTRWRWLVRLVFYGALVVVPVVLALHASVTRRLVFNELSRWLDRNYSVNMIAGSWDFSLLQGSVDVRNLYLSKKDAFVCRIPRVHIDFVAWDLLRGRITVEKLQVVEPVVDLSLSGGTGGQTQNAAAVLRSIEGVTFHLENVAIKNGRIRLQAVDLPVNFTVREFDFSFSGGGRPSPHRLRLALGGLGLRHNGHDFLLDQVLVQGGLTAEGLNLSVLKVRAPFIRFSGTGGVRLAGDISYRLDGFGRFELDLLNQTMPDLPVSLRGDIRYALSARGKGTRQPVIEGRMEGLGLAVGQFKIRTMSARLNTRNDQYRLTSLRLEMHRGSTISGEVSVSVPKRLVSVRAICQNFSLKFLKEAGLMSDPLDGSVDAEVSGQFPFSGSPDVNVMAQVAGLQVLLPNRRDFYYGDFIRGSARYKDHELTFRVDAAYGEGLVVSGTGRYKNRELWVDQLSVVVPGRGEGRNLLLRVARMSTVLQKRLQGLQIRGHTLFDGSLHLKGTFPDVQGRLRVEDVMVAGTSWHEIECFFRLNRQRLIVEKGRVQSPDGDVRIGLNLQISPETILDKVDISAHDIPYVTVESLLHYVGLQSGEPRMSESVSGRLTGTLNLDKSHGDNWTGRFEACAEQVRVAANELGKLCFSGEFHESTIALDKIDLNGDYLSLDGQGEVNRDTGTLNLKGLIHQAVLEKIPQLKTVSLSGVAKGDYLVRGTLQHPEIAADLRASQVTFQGEPVGDLRFLGRMEAPNIMYSMQLNYQENVYNALGSIRLGDNPVIESTVFLSKMRIKPILKQLKNPFADEINGTVTGDLFLSYPLNDPSRIEASARLSEIDVNFRHLKLHNQKTFYVQLENGKLTLDDVSFDLNGDSLDLRGELSLFPLGDMQVYLNGKTRLDLLHPFFPEVFPSGGINLQLLIRGNPRNPSFSGRVDLSNASMKLKSPEISLKKINGTLELTSQTLKTNQLSFETPYGKAALSGECVLEHFSPTRWALEMQSDKVSYAFPAGFFTEASVDLRFTGTPTSSILEGDIWIERTAPVTDMDLADLVTTIADLAAKGPAEVAPSWQKDVTLNLELHGDRSIIINSDTLDFVASADLQVRGFLDDPVLRGNFLINNGEIKYKMNRFVVDRGHVSFVNPVENDPEVQIQISSDIKDYQIKVILEGPASRLRTSLTSVPSLPTVDIVRLITTGYLPADEGTTVRKFQSVDTTGILSQLVSATVEKRLKRVVGLDTISVDTYRTSAETSTTARFTVGKQISRDLYVTYSKSVSSEEQDLVQIEYRFSRRITIVASRDERGYFGLDFRFRKKFR